MSRRATKNLPPGEWLTVCWRSTRDDGPDVYFAGPRRCDMSLMRSVFCVAPVAGVPLLDRALVDELEARGYDITTLELRVRRKPAAG